MDNPEEPKPISVTERLTSIETKLDVLAPKPKEGKRKWFKLPFGFKGKQKKVLKTPNKIQVLYLRTNTRIDTLIAEIKDGFFNIEDRYYNVNRLFIWYWIGKIPTVILPEWSINPIGNKDYYDEWKNYTEGQKGIEAQKIIIRAMELAEVQEKKGFGGKWWIWLILGAVALGFLFFWNGGAK